MQNLTAQASVNQTECLINQKSERSKSWENFRLLYQKNKQERTKRKDQPWRRLATVNKIAQKAGYNLPDYSEKRTIAELLKQHGEYSYLTGKKLGAFYLSTLDIDIRKEEFPEKLIERLVKNTTCLLDFLKVSYDQTKKGLHVDILTPEPLENGIIYWADKLGKQWTIGSIQSLGKYVVGEDPNKFFVKNGKWYWKTKSNEEVKTTLNKFFFYLNSQQKTVKKSIEITEDTSLNIPLPKNPTTQPKKYTTIQAKILSIQKTNLEKIWKIFYLEQQGNRGYFLLNHYHRKNFNLDIGATRNILLINGHRHSFFSRFI